MGSMKPKKIFRAVTGEKRKLSNTGKRKLIAAAVALTAAVLVLISAGAGYKMRKDQDSDGIHSFGQLESSLIKQMREELKATSEYLDKLDGNIENNQKKLEQVNSRLDGRQDSLLEVETTQRKLSENASDVSVKVKEMDRKVDLQIKSLSENMDALHKEIKNTRTDISDILHFIEEEKAAGEADGQEIRGVTEVMKKISLSIAGMDTEMKQSYDKLKELLRQMEEKDQNGRAEMILVLQEVEKNMQSLLELDMVQITDSFHVLTQDFLQQTGRLEQSMNVSFTQLNQNLAQQFELLSSASGDREGALKSYLDIWKAQLSEELNQVFTSVSNGKRILASALLTKGVETPEDAAFAQIRDAILKIPQKLVIGVTELPGTITYRYHYHLDAEGGTPHRESMQSPGGCYTLPRYHTHSEAAGCYKTQAYHEHNKSCPGHPYWVDWEPSEPDGYWAFSYDCGNKPDNASHSVFVCTRNGNSVDCYLPSCGLSDGQLIGADIIYDSKAAGQDLLTWQLPEPVFVTGKKEPLPEPPGQSSEIQERIREALQKPDDTKEVTESEMETKLQDADETMSETDKPSKKEEEAETNTVTQTDVSEADGTAAETETELTSSTQPEEGSGNPVTEAAGGAQSESEDSTNTSSTEEKEESTEGSGSQTVTAGEESGK